MPDSKGPYFVQKGLSSHWIMKKLDKGVEIIDVGFSESAANALVNDMNLMVETVKPDGSYSIIQPRG